MGTQDGGAADGGSGRRRRRRRRRKPAQPGAATQPASTDAHEPTAEAQAPPKAQPARKTTGKRRKKKPPIKTPGKGPVHKEISAGGVVYRRVDDGIEVVLASRRTRRGELAWGLAKGGIEEGESHEEAAVREVQEETGLTAEIEASLGETKYFYVWEDTRIRKTVHFFLMRHTGGDPADHDDEMEEIRWFPLERAMKRAAYRGEREVIGRAAELLR
ncbi:MAG TPA: NUDIX hydrolase [Actinomycetota bacterium]|jgi:8-oxo-dGTP pyrophosphatase MutT (NUDIX family)